MTETSETMRDLPPRPPGRVLRAAEAQAWQDGFQFLSAAKGEAQQLTAVARQAYAQEYVRGYEDGKSEGDTEASRIVAEATAKVDRYLATLEGEVVALAMEVARRVLGAFDDKALVAQSARQAVMRLRRAKYMKVSVHPDSIAQVRGELAAFASQTDAGFTLEIIADPTLAPQACIVATDIAVMDASVEAQLRGIEKALRVPAANSSGRQAE